MIAPKPTPVAIATIMRPEGYTGVQTHTRLLHGGIAQAGFPCSVLTPFSGSKKWLPVFAVRPILLHRLNKNWSTRWHRHWHFAALRENLLRHLACNPVKTLIAQCPLSALAALDVRERLGRDLTIALVCHFNVSEADEFREKGELNDEVAEKKIRDLEKQVIQSVDVVIHNSDWQRSTIEEYRGIRPKSSTVIWYGIPATVPDHGVTRRELGLGPDDLVLIYIGSLEPRKNQLGLLDLFAEVSTRYSHAKLFLVGGDGPQRSAIQRKIKRHGLDSKVRLLLDRPDVPALLRIADIYIHYATLESFGIVLAEAARAGLPLAAIPVGGVSDVLSQLQGGIPLHVNDPRASLEALRPLLEDPALRAEMGRRARRNFDQFFTQEVMVGNYLRALGLIPGDHACIQGTSHEPRPLVEASARRYWIAIDCRNFRCRLMPPLRNRARLRCHAVQLELIECISTHRRIGGSVASRASTATERSRGGWLTVLCLTLLGYASFGKGWAYLGIPPLYIGELVLLCGVASLVMSGRWAGIFDVLPFWFLLAFMAWGRVPNLALPLPLRCRCVSRRGDLGLWRVRDRRVRAHPRQAFEARAALGRYSQFAQIFPVIAPVIWLGCRFFHAKMPHWPWANVPIVDAKPGDLLVLMAGILAFWVAGLAGGIGVLRLLLLGGCIVMLGAYDRGGLVAFILATYGICFALRPHDRLLWRLMALGACGVIILAVTSFRFNVSTNQRGGGKFPSSNSQPTYQVSHPDQAPTTSTTRSNGGWIGGGRSSNTPSTASFSGRARGSGSIWRMMMGTS